VKHPDIPPWLRVSDREQTIAPALNPTVDWQRLEPVVIGMLEDGMRPVDIAKQLGISAKAVAAKCNRLVKAGKVEGR
jgi:DNA-binding NarL/FixJ family response regulator